MISDFSKIKKNSVSTNGGECIPPNNFDPPMSSLFLFSKIGLFGHPKTFSKKVFFENNTHALLYFYFSDSLNYIHRNIFLQTENLNYLNIFTK